jgi:energy-coupling factor transporter transmembrane protein EcfT
MAKLILVCDRCGKKLTEKEDKMKVFEGLKFRKKFSLIHYLDPRTKFLISSINFSLALIFPELLAIIILLLAQIPLIFLAKIQKEWSRSLRGGLFLMIIIFSTNLSFWIYIE